MRSRDRQDAFTYVIRNDVERIKSILETSPEVILEGEHPLIFYCKSVECFKAVEEAKIPFDWNKTLPDGRNLLFFVYSPKVVKFLVEKGVNLNVSDTYHTTPLIQAIKNGDLELVKTLLMYGADPNLETPIVLADTPELLDLLMGYGAYFQSRPKKWYYRTDEMYSYALEKYTSQIPIRLLALGFLQPESRLSSLYEKNSRLGSRYILPYIGKYLK